MLYIIGLGLYDEQDITVRGLAAVKSCKRVYLEAYTSILLVDKEKLVSPQSNILQILKFPLRLLRAHTMTCRRLSMVRRSS